jgi:hypothetical protein
MVAELSTGTGANGTFNLNAPNSAAANYAFRCFGTVQSDAVSASSFAAPITNVVSGLGDIASDTSTLRINGTQAAQNTGDLGTGNFLAYPLYIGARNGSSLFFSGHLYGLIARFGPNLTSTFISATETWVANKTGIVIA